MIASDSFVKYFLCVFSFFLPDILYHLVFILFFIFVFTASENAPEHTNRHLHGLST